MELAVNGLWPRGLGHGAKDGTSLCGKVFGPIWIRGTACGGAQPPRTGTIQESMDRTVSMAE